MVSKVRPFPFQGVMKLMTASWDMYVLYADTWQGSMIKRLLFQPLLKIQQWLIKLRKLAKSMNKLALTVPKHTLTAV